MQTSIRLATVSDAIEINRLSHQFGYTVTTAETNLWLSQLLQNKDEIVYVALLSDIVIGWIQVSFYTRLESGNACEITGLVVDENHRSKGIGKLLVQHAQQWCKEKHCSRLRVRSNLIRTDAHRFYTNIGFEIKKQQAVFDMGI